MFPNSFTVMHMSVYSQTGLLVHKLPNSLKLISRVCVKQCKHATLFRQIFAAVSVYILPQEQYIRLCVKKVSCYTDTKYLQTLN